MDICENVNSMTMQISDFTVLSSVYDAEKPENLELFFETINRQSISPVEIILCCDGNLSLDLESVIKSYNGRVKLRVLRNPKLGLAKNLQIGLNKVRTTYAARCDTDDWFVDERFECQFKLITETGVDIVSSFTKEVMNGEVVRIKPVPVGAVDKFSWHGYFLNPVNHNSCMFKVESILNVGGYDDTRMEDFILWAKCLRSGLKIFNTNEALTFARADDIYKRRLGSLYMMAEISLLKINALRAPPFSIFISVLAFSVRFPLRTPILSYALRVAINFIRLKNI